MISTPDPSPVRGPSSAMPIVKMQGNMIELNNPTQDTLHIATCPALSTDTEIATRPAAHDRRKSEQLLVLIFCRMADPINRPTIAPPQ